jgi:hypothetical protein
MKKLIEIVVVTKTKTTRIKDGRIMKEVDIWRLCDSIERNHKERPVITHPHFGDCKETLTFV